jgi:hypothetical protein
MVQIDYEITIFYKAFFIKKFFQGRYPRTPTRGAWTIVTTPTRPPCNCSGGTSPPTPPVGVWGPNMTETRNLNTRKIIRLHTQ